MINRPVEQNKTLDTLIDKLKKIAEEDKSNYHNPTLFFDGDYLALLAHESNEFMQLCQSLNNDDAFMLNVNLVFNGSNQALSSYKAEHFLLHDLIKAYNSVITAENEKSRFTLAYFFECLSSTHAFKGISISRLNELVSNANFIQNVETIKQSKIIVTDDKYKDEYVLPSILYRSNHYLFHKSANLIYRFASIVVKADNQLSDTEKSALKELLQKTTSPLGAIIESQSKTTVPENDTLESVIAEINGLVGLDEIKKSIQDLINFLKIQKIRTENGLDLVQTSLHAVFLGPPGTGKTTVARLLARVFKHLGLLQKGHLIETDRAGMVAGFVGQTALKVDKIVENSLDGLLFVDEAYSLVTENSEKDFGSEAIDALVKRMEDNRDRLVVVVAGYTEPMKFFIESNPGLRSRFNRYFEFKHFLPTQLLEIMKTLCEKSDFMLTNDASDKLLLTFEMLYEKRDDSFGNARVVRNLFERCVQNQANRLINHTNLTKELLQSIDESDVPEPNKTLEQVFMTKE